MRIRITGTIDVDAQAPGVVDFDEDGQPLGFTEYGYENLVTLGQLRAMDLDGVEVTVEPDDDEPAAEASS